MRAFVTQPAEWEARVAAFLERELGKVRKRAPLSRWLGTPQPRRFVYRVIRGPVAVREDFLSDRVRGKRPWDDTSESVRRNEGFSVWASPEGAAAISRRFGHRLGRFVAEVQVPPGTRLEPFAAVPDHLTAYGDPDAFVGSVLRVTPVE